MEEPINYRRLYERHLEGKLTAEEYTLLLLHFHRQGQETKLREPIEKTFATSPPESWESQDHVQETFRRVANKLRHTIIQDTSIRAKRVVRRRYMRLLPYAAAVVVALVAGVLFWEPGSRNRSQQLDATEILPGGNRATLTLADGTIIDLSSEKTGIVVGDHNITYTDGANIVPSHSSANEETKVAELVLSTPKGGTYQITLPDGSNVWLNANSTLKYPSRFSDASREVVLEGEAYFEIAHKELASLPRQIAGGALVPFIVKTPAQIVEVLGTKFNVSAYTDEPNTKTTLLKGKVKVLPTDQGSATTLSPGQQATTHDTGITVSKVDVQQYIAWKDGFFYFDGMAPQSALSQLGRWYDIDIVYRGKTPNVRFFGMLDKHSKLNDVLLILKESGLGFDLVRSGNKHQLVVFGE